jgi:hypothetical protein
MKWFRMPIAQRSLAAGVLLFLMGCGNGQGTVSGKVTLDGKPLPGGIITINDAAGLSPGGGIGKDGSYSVSNVAPGPAVITVLTVGTRPSLRDPNNTVAAPNPHGEFVEIPGKYVDKGTSGLSLDVKGGKQDHNVELKSEPK